MLLSMSLFLLAFGLLWVGSGVAVRAITTIAHSLRMSSFFVSFFVLGFFTSITEIMVGVNALITNRPEIFVGNLIGSSVVIFLLVVPLLAVLGNGVSLNHSFRFKDLVSAVVVVGFPALLILDGGMSLIDAVVCLVVYLYFVFMQEKQSGSLNRLVLVDLGRKTIYVALAKVLVAILLVFTGSRILVEQTVTLADLIGVSPFMISLLIISVGTNVPELSIALRAVLAKKKDVAFGNYLGSASMNTLEIGVLTLLGMNRVEAQGSSYSMMLFLIGLSVFLYFGKSRNTISRGEGLGLLGVYGVFLLLELVSGPGWQL